MGFYEHVVSHGGYMLLVLGGAVLALVVYGKTKRGHMKLSQMVLKVPFLGKVLAQTFISIFCRTLSTLLSAGVPVIQSFGILVNMTNNDRIKEAVNQTKDNIVKGTNISLSMSVVDFFPSLVSKMVQVGEESGSLPAVLDKTSEYYEKEVESAIEAFTKFLEPAMIIIVGAIVLVIVLALYLPIFSLSNN